MEIYEAKYDYLKERDDVLSFARGEKFYITSRSNDKWWAAKKLADGSCGYVPSIYLKISPPRVIQRLVPEGRSDTKEHHIHLQALAEIHKRVKPLPVSPPPIVSPSPPPPDYDMEDDPGDENNVPFHHKLNSSGRYVSISSDDSNPDLSPTFSGAEEPFLIKPKPLPNPIKESKDHQQLHREFMFSVKRGKVLPEQPELFVVQRERKLDEKKKEFEEAKRLRRTSMEVKLQERQEKERMEEEKDSRMAKFKQQEAIDEERKPEFMKVQLKQTNSLLS